MTEQEAKTKWCPFARLIPARRLPGGAISHNDVVPTFNRYNTDEKSVVAFPSGAVCLGSACMAWRQTPIMQRTEAHIPASLLATEHYVTTWSDSGERHTNDGYCGLAGRP